MKPSDGYASYTPDEEATRRFLADIEEPRLGIHEDGTEEMKSWECLYEQCREAARWIRALRSAVADTKPAFSAGVKWGREMYPEDRDAVIEECAKAINKKAEVLCSDPEVCYTEEDTGATIINARFSDHIEALGEAEEIVRALKSRVSPLTNNAAPQETPGKSPVAANAAATPQVDPQGSAVRDVPAGAAPHSGGSTLATPPAGMEFPERNDAPLTTGDLEWQRKTYDAHIASSNPQMEADSLVSITVDGSTHTRTAAEWLKLARDDLAGRVKAEPYRVPTSASGETPRTDAHEKKYQAGNDWAEYRHTLNFARQLERELRLANAGTASEMDAHKLTIADYERRLSTVAVGYPWEAEQTPAVQEAVRKVLEGFGEIPDRNSPDDFPEGYVLTRAEIVEGMLSVLSASRSATANIESLVLDWRRKKLDYSDPAHVRNYCEAERALEKAADDLIAASAADSRQS